MDEKDTTAFLRQYFKLMQTDDQERMMKAMREAMDSVFSENDNQKSGASASQKKADTSLSVPIGNGNTNATDRIDVVIIVAVPDEKVGVYTAFGLDPDAPPKKYDMMGDYRFDYVQFEEDDLNIALLIQPSMGMTQAASMTTRAILALQPRLVAMVGVCAGCEETAELGDIIIASNVYDYTAGKHYIDRFGPRPQSYPIDNKLSNYITGSVVGRQSLVAKILDRNSSVKTDHQVKILFKPIASGTAVVNDPEVVKDLINKQDNLAGIDMEAYALAVSSTILETKWLVIKGVQDYANGDKENTEKGYRGFAAYSSAKLLQLMLKEDLPRYF